MQTALKELVIISGKGGTGKTSLTAALASLAHNKVLCDTDVDAADLHLVMAPAIQQQHDFQAGHTAIIDAARCNACGLCRDLCRWEAISETFEVDAIACEGCGVCVHFCPEKAIDFPSNTCGQWFISNTRSGPMVHARLGIAAENSGKLVSLVRQQARQLAQDQGLSLILTDGPPGVGCPVIASIGGADALLVVTEPTVSGIHDMERVISLARHFKAPALICINKHDIYPEAARQIHAWAQQEQLPVVGEIPFDPAFTHAMVQGQTLIEYAPTSKTAIAVGRVWEKILERV